MSTLLLVHAHPDDEAVATAGVMLKAKQDGHRVVLVTCTRGEEGEIHTLDEVATRPRLGEVRTAELKRACEILNVDRLEFLGYRDSGMAGVPSNDHPECFARSGLYEAAQRLITILREERPEVVVTYGPDGTYGHPDHIRAHQTTVAALEILAREGGEQAPWKPAKSYWLALPRRQMGEMFKRMAAGRPASAQPGAEMRLIGVNDDDITTVVDVRRFIEEKRASFAVHVTQNDPKGMFVTMAAQIYEAAFGTETFILHRGTPSGELPERDLFEGL